MYHFGNYGVREQFLYDGRKERVGAPDKTPFSLLSFLDVFPLTKSWKSMKLSQLYYRPCPNDPFGHGQIVITSQDIFG